MSFKPELSVEFFPPKGSNKGDDAFWSVVKETSKLNLDFVSVTYGAGGSTKDRSMQIAHRIQQEYNMPVAMHLTCVDAEQQYINDIAQQCWDLGIKRIVALRGDPKTGVGSTYQPYPGGYAYASDLVLGLKKVADFDISVAAYPEKHPQAKTLEADINVLKRKQDAGADRALTQFFFDNDTFLRFRDKAVGMGVTIPIIPGLLSLQNFKQSIKFAKACGTHIPERFIDLLDTEEQEQNRLLLATHLFLEQCQYLQANGVEGFHFYGMNRLQPVAAAVKYLNRGLI